VAIQYQTELERERGSHQQASGEVERLQALLAAAQRDVADLQDKLTTTERNYSAQLTMMTEHIFSLNTQIQTQQQELERRQAARAASGAGGAGGSTPTRGAGGRPSKPG